MENNVNEAPEGTDAALTDTSRNPATKKTSSSFVPADPSLSMLTGNVSVGRNEQDDEGLLNVDKIDVEIAESKPSMEKVGEFQEEGEERSVEELESLKREKRRLKREAKRKRQEEYLTAMGGQDAKRSSLVSKKESIKEFPLETQSDLDLNRSILSGDLERESRSTFLSGEHGREKEEASEDEVSTSSDESEYTRPMCSVNFKEKFLEFFAFPSMSDITTESSKESILIRSTVKSEQETVVEDVGKFVDPLVGGSPPTSVIDGGTEHEEQEEEEEEETSTSIEFDWPFDLEDEVIPVVAPSTEVEFNMDLLLEINASIREESVESSRELKQYQIQREIRKLTIEFLFQLFDDVVKTSEFVDPAKTLAEKLSKQKLLANIRRSLTEYSSVKKYNSDLSNKMYEYYRRSGHLRAFDHLPYESEVRQYRRYIEALSKLDFLRNQIAQTKKQNRLLLESVKMDIHYEYSISQAADSNLENFVRKTILRKDAEHLPRIVERELRIMNQIRNEISDCRLLLITRHHTLGRLLERKNNFDQISEHLTIDDFLIVQRELGSLGTKVEERNNDLCRIRDRCSKQMLQISYIREKTSMNRATLQKFKAKMDKKRRQQSELRDIVLKLKYKSASLKRERKELQEKAEMLNRPSLLHDYDDTVDFIEAKRCSVKALKKTFLDLETRIAAYEKRSSLKSQRD